MKHKKPDIRIGFPFFASAAFFLSGELWLNYIYALIFSLLHETGHLVAMLHFGCVPDRITLGITGIRIEKKELSLSAKQECITAICGPSVNLILLFLFAFDMGGLAFIINFGLLMFNLLPLKSLDGGRFIYNLVLMYSDSGTASAVMKTVGIFTVILLIAVLVASLVYGFYNTTFMLFVVMLVATAVSELLSAV